MSDDTRRDGAASDLYPELTDEGRAQIRAEQRAMRQRPDRRAQGLVIVNTGDGKGKTTAALGILTRAWGRGLRVCMLQFI